MGKDNNKRKSILYGMGLLLLCCIWLGGCVSGENTGSTEHMDDTRQALGVWQESPTIEAENPLEENLAGMLQEQSAGMMVQIIAGENIGSGIIYEAKNDTIIIVTAGHVLENLQDFLTVIFFDGWAVQSSDYILSANADLAFIRIPGEQIPKEHQEAYFYARADLDSFDGSSNGDGVILMGSLNGVAGNAYEGVLVEQWIYVEDFDGYMMLAEANAMEGMSGGGLFNQRGELLGILCGGNDQGQVAAVPLSILRAVYEELQL